MENEEEGFPVSLEVSHKAAIRRLKDVKVKAKTFVQFKLGGEMYNIEDIDINFIKHEEDGK